MPKRNMESESYDGPPAKWSRHTEEPSTNTGRLTQGQEGLTEYLQPLQSQNSQGGFIELSKSRRTRFHEFMSIKPLDHIGDGEEGKSKPDAGLHLPVTRLESWTKQDVPVEFPSLPPIRDSSIEKAVFTHPARARPGEQSYETLEWRGDGFVYEVATHLIFKSLPSLPHGRASQIRELLVKNSTLARISRHYGLDQMAHVPHEVQENMRSKQDQSKYCADLLEAYVGGIVTSDVDNGSMIAGRWLRAIWIKILQEQAPGVFGELRDVPGLPAGQPAAGGDGCQEKKEDGGDEMLKGSPKDQLANLIMVRGVKIRYEDQPCHAKDRVTGLPLYTVGVFADGWGESNVKLGWGTAMKKTEAGMKAAEMAMQSRKKLKPWIERKHSYIMENPPKTRLQNSRGQG